MVATQSARVYQSPLVTALAAVFAAMSGVLGAVAVLTGSWIALLPVALFAAVAYFMWYHASGRLADRVYRTMEDIATGPGATEAPGGFGAGPREAWERPRQDHQSRGRERVAAGGRGGRGRRGRTTRRSGGTGRQRTVGVQRGRMAAREAAAVLGVEPGADDETVRAAYRDRIKDVHPDTDGGDEDEFKRVRDAYEHLTE